MLSGKRAYGTENQYIHYFNSTKPSVTLFKEMFACFENLEDHTDQDIVRSVLNTWTDEINDNLTGAILYCIERSIICRILKEKLNDKSIDLIWEMICINFISKIVIDPRVLSDPEFDSLGTLLTLFIYDAKSKIEFQQDIRGLINNGLKIDSTIQLLSAFKNRSKSQP